MIGSVGFPIVACFAMWKSFNTTIKNNTMVIQELKEAILNMEYKKK